MDAELEARVRDLLSRSQEMEWGSVRVMLAEEAVRLADVHGEPALGFEARQVLVEAAVFSDLDERAVAPFTWCLAAQDRDPQRFPDAQGLLWQYKWIVSAALGWPQIPRERVHAMIEDMERRHRQHGFSARAANKLRLDMALLMGDTAAAQTLYRSWRTSPRDDMSDCDVCECHDEVRYWNSMRGYGRALQKAIPILEGRLSCSSKPRETLAEVLLPLVKAGRLEDAAKYHNKGHRLSVRNAKWTEDAAAHIVFLALTGHLVKAVHMFESHFPFPCDPMAADRFSRFQFFLAARFLLERLGTSGRSTIKLRLSNTFPAHAESGAYEVAALASWFETESRRIAARFDARHGNDGFQRRIEANLALKTLVAPVALRPARTDRPS